MAEVSHLQHEKEQLLVCVRREERRRRDALRDLQRANEERDSAQQSLQENQTELQQLKEAYRKHLGSILESESPQIQPRTTRSSTDSNDFSWQMMAESYIQTEKKLLADAERGNENLRKTTAALRKLYDHYRYLIASAQSDPLQICSGSSRRSLSSGNALRYPHFRICSLPPKRFESRFLCSLRFR